jgi:hypothetical protein
LRRIEMVPRSRPKAPATFRVAGAAVAAWRVPARLRAADFNPDFRDVCRAIRTSLYLSDSGQR